MTNAFIGVIRTSGINKHIFVVALDGNEALVLRNPLNHFPTVRAAVCGVTKEKDYIIGL
jgi:hypothetical protein